MTVARHWGENLHFTRQVNVGGRWVVGLPSVNLVQKFVQNADNIATITGWRPASLPPKAPCLRLTRLPRKLTTAQLVGELQDEKNSVFHAYRELFGEMYVLRQTETTVILRLHPALRIALLQHQEQLLIRRTCPGVEDIVPLQQCFHCCKFGHSKANCQHPPRCIFCAKEHAGAQCSHSDNTFMFACGNCKDAKRMTRGHAHPAIDVEYCPVAQDRKKSLRLQMVYDPALYTQLFELWKSQQPARPPPGEGGGAQAAATTLVAGQPSDSQVSTDESDSLAARNRLFIDSQSSPQFAAGGRLGNAGLPAPRPHIAPIPPPPVVPGKSPSFLDLQLRELAKHPPVPGYEKRPPPPPPPVDRSSRPKIRPVGKQGDGRKATLTSYFKTFAR